MYQKAWKLELKDQARAGVWPGSQDARWDTHHTQSG